GRHSRGGFQWVRETCEDGCADDHAGCGQDRGGITAVRAAAYQENSEYRQGVNSMSKILASQLLDLMGGKENIASIYNCMTRVRAVANDRSKIDMENIKSLDGVNGVVDDDEFQIILGPGAAEKTRREMEKQIGEVETDGSVPKKKGIKYLLKKIGNIFIPLIPALVASGLINGAV